jgi:hypothetical protein
MTREDRKCFLLAQRLFSENSTAEMENGKWKMGREENFAVNRMKKRAAIRHRGPFSFSILHFRVLQTL